MKKLFGLALVSSALMLTACGGSSESSSYSAKKTLGNGNVYTCTSEAAMSACTSDATCASNCTLTTKAVNPNPAVTQGSCAIDANKNVSVTTDGCTYSSSSFNAGQTLKYTCVNGKVTTSGGLNLSSTTISDGDYTLKCATS